MESATPEAQPPEAQTRPTSYRYWLFLLAFIVGAALIVNHSLARHQSLFLVNGLGTPATVIIDGGRPEPLSPRTWHKVRIGEGTHHAVIAWAGGATEEVGFEVRNDFYQRVRCDSVFVLNLGAATPILRQTVTYATTPVEQKPPPDEYRFGPFLTYRSIDYVFKAFPDHLLVQNRYSTLQTTRVCAVLAEPADFLVPLAEAKAANPEELLACAERHLLVDPGNDALVRTYTILAETLKEGARCKDFLAKRLMRAQPDQSQ